MTKAVDPPLRLLLVGAGRIASDWLRVIDKVPAVDLVGIADLRFDLAKAVAETRGVPAHATVEAALAAGAVDAALVAVPPSSHDSVSQRCLEAGAHVLCEKPFTLDRASAERLFEIADQRGLHLSMSAKFRHVPDVIAAKARLAAGAIGEPLCVRQSFLGVVPMRDRWNSDPAQSGGGVWIDNGTHSVDLLRYLFGPIAWVVAAAPRANDDLAVEDTMRVLCGFATGAAAASGMTAVIDTSWSLPATEAYYLECFGTAGSLHLGWSDSILRSDARRVLHVGDGYDKMLALQRQLEHFVACARGLEEPVLDREDILASVAVIEAGYRSLRDAGRRCAVEDSVEGRVESSDSGEGKR